MLWSCPLNINLLCFFTCLAKAISTSNQERMKRQVAVLQRQLVVPTRRRNAKMLRHSSPPLAWPRSVTHTAPVLGTVRPTLVLVGFLSSGPAGVMVKATSSSYFAIHTGSSGFAKVINGITYRFLQRGRTGTTPNRTPRIGRVNSVNSRTIIWHLQLARFDKFILYCFNLMYGRFQSAWHDSCGFWSSWQ